MKGWVISFVLFQIFVGAVCDQVLADNVTVKAVVEKSSVQVAEPFEVEIVATTRAGVSLGFPEVGEMVGDFDVLSHSDSFDVPIGDDPTTRTWSRKLVFETIVTGSLSIPVFEIGYRDSTNRRQTFRTNELSIEVVSVLAESDDNELRDIKPVIDLEVKQVLPLGWLGWLTGAALLLTVAIGLFVLRSGKRHKRVSVRRWVDNQFEAMRRSDLVTTGNSDQVFGKLESIVRMACEAEFDFPATSATHEQLLVELSNKLPSNTCGELKKFFDESESARYAGLAISGDLLGAKVSETEKLIDKIMTSRLADINQTEGK